MSRIFAAINDVTQPAFYVSSGNKLSLGFWFGFILCLISLGCAIVLVMLDIRADQSCVQIEVPVEQMTEAEEKEEEEEVEDAVQVLDLKKLPKVFWLFTGNCVFIYMSFMSFMNVASDMLQSRFNFSLSSAGAVLVFSYSKSILTTIF